MHATTVLGLLVPLLFNSITISHSSTAFSRTSVILPSLASLRESVQNVSQGMTEKAVSLLKPFKIINLPPRIESRNFMISSTPQIMNLTRDVQPQGPLGFYDITHRDGSSSGINRLLPKSFETSKELFKKLNVFSRLKRISKDSSDLATSESSHTFRPFMLPPPPGMMIPSNPLSPPFSAASMRYLSYHYPPYPYFPLRRMTSLSGLPPLPSLPSLSRMSYGGHYGSSPYSSPYGAGPYSGPYSGPAGSPSSLSPLPVPAYFPLGSMTGTPILDPAFHAALASSLTNRYTPPSFGLGGLGSSGYGSSFYDDFDYPPSSSLKRYFSRPASSSNSLTKYSNNKYRDDFGDTLPYSSKIPSSSYNDKYRGSKNRDPNHKYNDSGNKYDNNKYDNYKDPPPKYDPYPIPAEDGRPITGSIAGPNGGDSLNDAPLPPHPLDDGLDDPRYSKGTISGLNNSPPIESSTSHTPKFKDYKPDYKPDYKQDYGKEKSKDTNSDSYVDLYGWRGPSVSVPKQQGYMDNMDDGSYRPYDGPQGPPQNQGPPSERQPYQQQKDYGSRSHNQHSNNQHQPQPPIKHDRDNYSNKDLEAASSSDKSGFGGY